jgi:hypothetical protein
MTIGTIFKFLKLIVQIYPIIRNTINGVIDMWIYFEAEKMRDQYSLKENKMIALRKAIKDAQNDQDRIALSIVLHELQNS